METWNRRAKERATVIQLENGIVTTNKIDCVEWK